MRGEMKTGQVIVGNDMSIHVDGFGDMTEDVARALAEMRHEEEQELATGAALARQRLIAKETGAETAGFKHGRGLVASIDARIVAYWERRYGRAFFADKSNLKAFLKEHPECAVRYIPKATVRGIAIPGKPQSRDDRLTIKP